MKICRLFLLLTASLFSECFEVRLSNLPKDKVLPQISKCSFYSEENQTYFNCGCYSDENQSLIQKRKVQTWFQKVAYSPKIEILRRNRENEKSKLKQDELKLMYQVFNYRSDLESAYKVAKQALLQYPDDVYWHQKAAEVCQWTGRSKEAMEHLRHVYLASPSKKLREELIRYSIDAYQYEMAMPLVKERLMEEPSKKNIDTFLYIWEQAGEPKKAAAFMKILYEQDPTQIYALEQALRLYLDLGKVQEAGKIVKQMEEKGLDSQRALSLCAYYYYLKKDIDHVYALLKKGKDVTDIRYLRQLSDIGWYLGKRKEASEASMQLEILGEATLQDYERMVATSKTDPALAMRAALKAWHLYKKSYFFLTFAYLAIEQKKYDAVLSEFDSFESTVMHDKSFKMDAVYYLMKAQVYLHTKHPKEAQNALMMAKAMSPGDPEIEAALLWYYMDNDYSDVLAQMIFEIEERGSVDSMLWLPLASGHFNLQHSDRASMYVKLLLKQHPDNTNIRFLYAYILQVQNETDAFMKQMHLIYHQLEVKRKRMPLLMQEQSFLDDYLKSAMYVVGPDEFEIMLRNSKKYLDKMHYEQLSYFWALRNNAHEQANMILYSMQRIEPWMKLNRALYLKDLTGVQDLLYKYYTELPSRDRVTAARQSGNLSFAYTLAFEGLENNREDELLYQQFKQYSEIRADHFEMTTGYLKRAHSLKQRYTHIKSRNYLFNGLWFESDIGFSDNSVIDSTILSFAPEHDFSVSAFLKKEFERGVFSFGAGYRDAMKSYYNAEVSLDWKFSDRWHMDLRGQWHAKASETIYTLLGGHKNSIAATVAFQYLPSTQLVFSADYAKFHSQDDVKLGDGEHFILRWQHIFRQGYPDLAGSVFAEYGTYDETEGSRGLIDRLMPYAFKALPEDFTNIGFSIQYGLQNENSYTRVWRPYAEFTPIYNSNNSNVSFALRGGIGGSINNQDHLVLGFDYNQAVNGTDETSFSLFVRYRLLY